MSNDAPIKPQVGKCYFLLLPGEEYCSEHGVLQLTSHTVVLIYPYYFRKDTKTYDRNQYLCHDTKRYPLASVKFIEEYDVNEPYGSYKGANIRFLRHEEDTKTGEPA